MAKGLFEQVNKELEAYKPELVPVELKGNIRSGEDPYGNEIMSMDVEDKGLLPVKEKRLKNGTKRIIFASARVAKHYLNHPNANLDSQTFPVPKVQPDDLNQYWIRKIFPENGEEE
ncbi:MAG: hypothetical protein ACXAC8_17600 [Candidatus Hodarchaeales archaeon]|jgi:hypothetical protein